MAIKMVREPSETPNINNIDDIVPMRYAYGNQNGYVIGKGNEISNTVNGLNFTVNSGRLVLQGVECDIDAVGVTITIDNIATKRYYVIYLQVNLGLNTAQILSSYDTATYPTIDAGDDLTENTTGVARLPLYRFTATSGIISDINKVVESVKYINENFIKNVKVYNASKINDIEIKKDENGIIKNLNNIISQRQLIYDGLKELKTDDGARSIINNVEEGIYEFKITAYIKPSSANIDRNNISIWKYLKCYIKNLNLDSGTSSNYLIEIKSLGPGSFRRYMLTLYISNNNLFASCSCYDENNELLTTNDYILISEIYKIIE